MRTTMRIASPEDSLSRLLEGLGQELIDASDDEIAQVAKELGMDLSMRTSAAFAGLKYPARVQLSDFFDPESCRRIQIAAKSKIKTLTPGDQ
jgi:hypothetical protein